MDDNLQYFSLVTLSLKPKGEYETSSETHAFLAGISTDPPSKFRPWCEGAWDETGQSRRGERGKGREGVTWKLPLRLQCRRENK